MQKRIPHFGGSTQQRYDVAASCTGTALVWSDDDAGDPQGRGYEGRSASFDRSQLDGDDGYSTPLGHRSRSPFLSGPGEGALLLSQGTGRDPLQPPKPYLRTTRQVDQPVTSQIAYICVPDCEPAWGQGLSMQH